MRTLIRPKLLEGTPQRLGAAALIMFGFGYALVPLYDVLCAATGLNGKSSFAAAALPDAQDLDVHRDITVELLSTVNASLPWQFYPETPLVKVHPGQVVSINFLVRNDSERTVTGQAVPSIAPGLTAKYLKKIECFCFSAQTLAPHAQRRLSVRFYIEKDLPVAVRTMSLSYTFFSRPDLG